MPKRLGKFERQQAAKASRWRASITNDNLHIPLREVKQSSDIQSPFAIATLQSKGARGGASPYGRTERFEPSTPPNPKRFGKTR